MNIKPLSFSSLKTVALADRKVDSDGEDFGAPFKSGGSFGDFLCSLPNLGCSRDLFRLRDAIVSAYRHKHMVILACGSHVLDSGLGPLLCRLIEQKIVSGLVLTGAALQQDVEIALSGRTVNARDRDLDNGMICVTEETGSLINEAINYGAEENMGIGQSVGVKLQDEELEHLDHSVVATAYRYGVPLAVLPAIGADSFDLHRSAHGESLGAAGMIDFRLLAGMLAAASNGVVLNIASSAFLPRALLQALGAAKNLGKTIENITSAAIDPDADRGAIADVVSQLSQPNGRGFCLCGPDELLVPLLFAAVLESIGDEL